MKKKILLIIFAILILPITFSEIIIQTTESISAEHQFIVNKYYFQENPRVPEESNAAILIKFNETEKTILQCSEAEFSFYLINPTLKTQTYSIGVKDFKGIVYLPPNLIIPSMEARRINLVLIPDCSISGKINPKITVETIEEKAEIPLLIHILPVEIDTITPNDCLYYFDEQICESDNYIPFYQGTRYYINLDEMFFDPDGDKLKFSASSLNLDIKIKKGNAVITPLYNYQGPEEVVFFTDDGKGGKAQSKIFYFHVLDNNKSSLENFILINFPAVIIFLILIFLILFLLALVVLNPGKKQEKEPEEEMPKPPRPKKKKIKKK